MIRALVIILNLLMLLVLRIFQGNVSVKMDVPAQVKAGSDFEVTITLNKGDLQGFSRFQQIMPAGLTASADQSANADFTFSDKRVRLIWLSVPNSDLVTVSYKVKVDERLKGTFTLGGKFSYIDNNERKSVDVDPVPVTILPSPNVDPSLIVDVNDFDKMAVPGNIATEGAPSVACIRQTPYPGTSAGDYVVTLLVNRQNAGSFAKIEEDVPQGYTAVAVNTREAIFTFKSQKAKFLWMSLPQEPYFTVSYRLIPKNQAKLPAPVVHGEFSYLDEDKTVSIPIYERNEDLASLSTDAEKQLVAEVLAGPVEPQSEVTQQVAKQESTQMVTAEKPQTPVVKDSGKEKVNAGQLAPEQGVYYRIQLAAGHRPVNIIRYFKKLKLGKQIDQEEEDGWKKYLVGSFSIYKEARDYRVHIWNTTPVKDAFVAAYNNGQRITVQEALMVTDQQWYR